MDMHESVGPLGIIIPDPDQGTPYIQVQFAMPSTMIMVWEPFEDGTPGGHNLMGFARRWGEWAASDEPFLVAIDPRFGHPVFIPRIALGAAGAVSLGIAYHRKEDVRAMHRGVAVPGQPTVRRLGNGAFEIGIPR